MQKRAGPRPLVVDGYGGRRQVLSFSPDSRWVAAASWRGQLGLRLWPVPGNDGEVRTLAAEGAVAVAFDPRGRYLVKYGGGTRVIPLDGSPERELQDANDEGSINYRLAVSPRGHRVATAFVYGTGARNLRVWDVETGKLRLFPLPPTASSAIDPVRRRAVTDLHFVDESTLFTAGDGGLRRWDVDVGTHEVVWAPEPEQIIAMSMSADGRVAISGASYLMGCRPAVLHDLTADEHREVLEYGSCVKAEAIDPSGRFVATGDEDGVVRVGRCAGGVPHVLLGHQGPVNEIGISPDRRWVASIAEDETLRVWPMPDLDKPPLHALPHDEIVAKLRSLTNIRAVRDSEAPTGWTIELGPFPGWKEVPEW